METLLGGGHVFTDQFTGTFHIHYAQRQHAAYFRHLGNHGFEARKDDVHFAYGAVFRFSQEGAEQSCRNIVNHLRTGTVRLAHPRFFYRTVAEGEVALRAATAGVDHRLFALFNQVLDEALTFTQNGGRVSPSHTTVRGNHQYRYPVGVGAFTGNGVV